MISDTMMMILFTVLFTVHMNLISEVDWRAEDRGEGFESSKRQLEDLWVGIFDDCFAKLTCANSKSW